MSNNKTLFSFIVPSFNEENNIRPFYDAAKTALTKYSENNIELEILFIDDGSQDNSYKVACSLPAKSGGIKVRAFQFTRNFGKEAALFAGLQNAKGDYICFIDSDLEQPPAVAFEMLSKLRSTDEYDCVAAYQEQRKGGPVRNFLSKRFYKALESSSGMKVIKNASDFRVFRRSVADALLSLPEYYRFSKGLFAWVGFPALAHPYTVAKRHSGSSTWSFRKLFSYAFNGLISFSTAPLRAAIIIGILSAVAAVIYLIYNIIEAFVLGIITPGYPTLVILLLFFGGMILLGLGIIGEYLGRTYIEGKRRPLYMMRQTSDDCVDRKTNDHEIATDEH